MTEKDIFFEEFLLFLKCTHWIKAAKPWQFNMTKFWGLMIVSHSLHLLLYYFICTSLKRSISCRTNGLSAQFWFKANGRRCKQVTNLIEHFLCQPVASCALLFCQITFQAHKSMKHQTQLHLLLCVFSMSEKLKGILVTNTTKNIYCYFLEALNPWSCQSLLYFKAFM